MLKINKKIEIGLIVFKHFYLKKKLSPVSSPIMVTVKDISNAYQISEYFVAKIMQKLCKKEILVSKQGMQGGYYLNINLNQLTFLDLIEIIDGDYNVVNCINSDKNCNYQDGCNIIDPMKQLNKRFKQFYQSLKVDELIKITFNSSSEIKKATLY